MESDSVSPKKLRKILPRPRNPQVVIINQSNDNDRREPPKLCKLKPQNNPPPLVSNAINSKKDSSQQNQPNILPMKNPLPPLAVINQQGVKINVVKAVWVPSATVPPNTNSQEVPQSSRTISKKPIPFNNVEVLSLCDDMELCCRLCGKIFANFNSLLDIFGSEGKTAKLQEKIRRCLPIAIKQSDKLPTTMCRECKSILDLSFDLLLTALETDKQLREKLLLKEKNGDQGIVIKPANVPSRSGEKTINIPISCVEKPARIVVHSNQAYKKKNNHDNCTTDYTDKNIKPGHPSFDHTYILRDDRKGPPADTWKKPANLSDVASAALSDGTKCHFCEKVFGDIEVLLQHVENAHADISASDVEDKGNSSRATGGKEDADDGWSDVSIMVCFKCKETCLDDEDLQFHLNYECPVCDVCNLKNRSRRACVLHLKKHHGVTIDEVKKKGDKLGNLKDGAKKKEQPSKQEDKEDKVGHEEGTDSMNRNEDNNGGGDPCLEEYECSTCHKIYSNYRNFQKHRRLHAPLRLETEVKDRTEERIYKCSVCPRAYNRFDNLRQHEKIHRLPGTQDFPCTHCDMKFESRKDRLEHERGSHSVEFNESLKGSCGITKPKGGRLWICGYCGRPLSSKLALTEHERIHTGAKPCICEYCGRCFRTKTNLNQHMTVHTRDRAFMCPTCGKGFSRKSFVTQHMRVHTGDKPYVCDICGKQFSQCGDMGRHRKKHGIAEKRNESADIKPKFKEPNSEVTRDLLNSNPEEVTAVSFIKEEAKIEDSVFACGMCVLEFNDLEELKEHQLNEHGLEYQEVEAIEVDEEEEMKHFQGMEVEEEETQYVLVVPN